MTESDQALATLAKTVTTTTQELSARQPYDITFPTIIHEIDGQKGYIIQKDGHSYTIPNALTTPLAVGQKIWVKIPQNNLNEMHICGIRQTIKEELS